MHDKEVKEKNEKADKNLQQKLSARQNELQPSLDLLLNDRREIIDENQQLIQDVTALRIKHSTAVDLLFKLKSTFELFIIETKQVDGAEAHKMAAQLIESKKNCFADAAETWPKVKQLLQSKRFSKYSVKFTYGIDIIAFKDFNP